MHGSIHGQKSQSAGCGPTFADFADLERRWSRHTGRLLGESSCRPGCSGVSHLRL